MSIGPIPMSKVYDFADRLGLDSVATRILVLVIQALDSTYMQSVYKSAKSKPAVQADSGAGWPRK